MTESVINRGAFEFPRRIVCLSGETVETLYLLGEQDRIVGVSGFCTRPQDVRSKPRVSVFNDANFDKTLDLKPDLVLTFSDVQAQITRELVSRGLTVWNFNQRSIAGILEMIVALARLVGKPEAGRELIEEIARGLDEIAAAAQEFPRRPRVFFEEWHDPLISGIGWVEELIEIAGGEVIFPELRTQGRAEGRVVNAAGVVERNPDVILASWCGKKIEKDFIESRAGWSAIGAIRNGHIYEIESSVILQPGPAALTEGVRLIHEILAGVVRNEQHPRWDAPQDASTRVL